MAKKAIKGQRYNLFRNPENLKENQETSLKTLFEVNEHLWTYRYPKRAGKYLDCWISWAKQKNLRPIIKFTKGLNRVRAKIISCIKYRITSAKLEAFNGVIKIIMKNACGYKRARLLLLENQTESINPSLLSANMTKLLFY